MLPRRLSIILAATAILLAGCEQKHTVTIEESDALTRPVARFESPDAPKAEAPNEEASKPETPEAPQALSSPVSRTGEEIYNTKCTVCHATGAAGAPLKGNRDAWEPRIATGFESLVQSVINGKTAMPPKAGYPDLTENEIRRTVAWLANQAGAQFAEPPASQ